MKRNPLRKFGKKIRKTIKKFLNIKPEWVTATETEVQFWLYEPKFNTNPTENEDFTWYSDTSSPDWCGEVIMSASMLHSIKSYYGMKEYNNTKSEKDYFKQFAKCKVRIKGGR